MEKRYVAARSEKNTGNSENNNKINSGKVQNVTKGLTRDFKKQNGECGGTSFNDAREGKKDTFIKKENSGTGNRDRAQNVWEGFSLQGAPGKLFTEEMERRDLSEEDFNCVCIIGKVISSLEFCNSGLNEDYYIMKVSVRRDSGVFDVLPVMFTTRKIDVSRDYRGMFIEVAGYFRSICIRRDGKRQNLVYIYARQHQFISEIPVDSCTNFIQVCGSICQEAVFRKTLKGKHICDVLLSVRRFTSGISDRIPCIVWGNIGYFLKNQPVGKRLSVSGRIQSRVYRKWVGEDTFEFHTVYELSAFHVDVL